MIRKLINYIENPRMLGLRILLKYFTWLPDKLFLQLRFWLETGDRLNLKNPKTFNEKLQWLKIYDQKPEYTTMVDKYEVKDYVAQRIDKQYIIRTIGVWDKFENIDFDKLPNSFVLKTTHGGGGGGVVICTDKSRFDKESARRKIEASMNGDIFKAYREWPYKNVPRRIIAEEFIGANEGELKDYKFFCFNGEPKFLKVDFGRFIEHHANYYDLDWNLLPFGEVGLEPVAKHIEERPQNFGKMVEIARKLSQGHKFLRVDLYNVDGKIYFGELTFYPAGGMGRFTSTEWEYKVGEMLTLQ